MSSDLHIAFCDRDAAIFAVNKWHYSRTMPAVKVVRFGVWESGSFRGVVLFGAGAAPYIHRPFGVKKNEAAELVRVALRTHVAPVTRIIAVSLRLLRREYPALKVIVSYADRDQGHHGGIYQGGNWTYLGCSGDKPLFWDRKTKRWIHSRAAYERKMSVDRCVTKTSHGKHKYAIGLDRATTALLSGASKPYPKRAL